MAGAGDPAGVEAEPALAHPLELAASEVEVGPGVPARSPPASRAAHLHGVRCDSGIAAVANHACEVRLHAPVKQPCLGVPAVLPPRSRREAVGPQQPGARARALVCEVEHEPGAAQRPAQCLLRCESHAPVQVVQLCADRERERAERKRSPHVHGGCAASARQRVARHGSCRRGNVATPESEQRERGAGLVELQVLDHRPREPHPRRERAGQRGRDTAHPPPQEAGS